MVGMQYDGANGVPGLRDELNTVENQFWVGHYSLQEWASEILEESTVDTGNTSHTSNLRAGLLLGKITSGANEGKVTHWNPSATDGSENLYGILAHMQNTDYQGGTADRFITIMVGGNVDPTKLLIPGQSSLGISGNANEFLIKNQLVSNGRFKLYKEFVVVDGGAPRGVVAKTADYTVTTADHGKTFTNRGAAGAVVFTLPATAYKGLRYNFHVVADQNVTVTAGTADTLVTFNNATADSVAFSTVSEKVGGRLEVVGDGTGWLVLHYGANTLTVTDA